MKKLVMTGLVAAMACGVQAATVYDKDGTKVEIKGDMQIQIRQKVGVDQDPYFDNDDTTVGFYAKHKNEAGVTTFSHLKMDWKGQISGSSKAAVDEASVGVQYGPVKVHIGRIDWGSDKFETDHAIEIADGKYAFAKDKGFETIQGRFDLGLAELVLSGDLAVPENGVDNDSVAEAYIVTNPKQFAGLALGLLYQAYQPKTVAADEDEGTAEMKPDSIDTVGVRARYSINKISVGADYSTNDDKDVMNASVQVKLPASSTVAVGYSLNSPDKGDDVGTWYANATHKLNKYSTVFAEVGGNDKDNTDMGYLAGMKVTF